MHLTLTFKALSLTALCLSLTACKSGYNRLYTDSSPDENAPPCTENLITASPNTQTALVYSLIDNLTCKKTKDYILSGQSLGDGNQITGNDSNKNYATLIEEIARSQNRRIAIASIDYENSAQFNAAELSQANEKLIEHANTFGGIVSISWTPQNPWGNSNNPLAHTPEVNLANLYSTEEVKPEGYAEFNNRLEIIISQLRELNDKLVPVLFSPYPSMNTSAMWYGPQSANDKDEKFQKLWNYTIDKIKTEGLKNIIWVYAPRAGRSSERVSATWGYPGTNAVDIVAPIAFSDDIDINNFDDYKNLDKPLGMTRLSPKSGDGDFDNSIYAVEWEDQYSYLAYWIADHDDNDTKHSLYGNKKYTELFQNSKIATTETIKNKKWLKE